MFKKPVSILIVIFFLASGVQAVTITQPQDGATLVAGEDFAVFADIGGLISNYTINLICDESDVWEDLGSQYYGVNDAAEDVTTVTSEPFNTSMLLGECNIIVDTFVINTTNISGPFGGSMSIGIPSFDSDEITVNFVAPPEESAEAVSVVRSFGALAPPVGGYFTTYLSITPNTDFTGIIIRETIPGNIEIYDSFMVQEPFASFDYIYDEATRELKFVIMDPSVVEEQWVGYWAKASEDVEPGEVMNFSGEWEVLEETGDIGGKQSLSIYGFVMPQCPISDSEMLGYIDQWANKEFNTSSDMNDQFMMEILEVWMTC